MVNYIFNIVEQTIQIKILKKMNTEKSLLSLLRQRSIHKNKSCFSHHQIYIFNFQETKYVFQDNNDELSIVETLKAYYFVQTQTIYPSNFPHSETDSIH